MNNIEIGSTGIKCDNPVCDWNDTTIGIDDYASWLNRPCPKCGKNLLTEKDLNNAIKTIGIAKMINALSPTEMKAMFGELDPENLEEFSAIPGADLLKGESGQVIMQVDTHEEIKITGFRKAE